MFLFILLVVVWGFLGFLAWGFTLGSHKHQFPDIEIPYIFLVISLLFGPFSLLATLATYGLNNWSLKPYTKEERLEIFKQKYPNLSNDPELLRIHFK